MTRILLKLAIALVTFEIGVTVTAIYRFYGVTDLVVPDVVMIVQRSSCFPGLSVRVPKSTAQTEFFQPAALSESTRNARFLNGWYSGKLAAMNERPRRLPRCMYLLRHSGLLAETPANEVY